MLPQQGTAKEQLFDAFMPKTSQPLFYSLIISPTAVICELFYLALITYFKISHFLLRGSVLSAVPS